MRTAWIIGSGPGLNRIDVRQLKNSPTFAFNRSYIAWDEWGFRPTYYCCIDLRVMAGISADINQLIEQGTCVSYHFCDPAAEGKNIEIRKQGNVHLYRLRDGWGYDIKNPYYCGDVAAFALQVAGKLGYKRVYVVGVDLVWAERGELIIDDGYERMGAEDNDVEHFRQDYYPAGFLYSNPCAEAHYKSWMASVAGAREAGLEVISCGPGSRLNEMVKYVEMAQALTG